jgi:U3 small nucleolar RNA-associated protein 3
LNELNEKLIPIYVKCIKTKKIPTSKATDYLTYKMKLYLMYCCHLSFYFMLKAGRKPVENHPIVKNIIQFRSICKQINTIDAHLEEEIDYILRNIENASKFNVSSSPLLAIKKKSVKFQDNKKTKTTREGDISFDDDSGSDSDAIIPQEGENGEGDGDEEKEHDRRAINYQIEKNKGLTPKRNKRQRNPRVANRYKARKANIKHKSIVPKVRSQDKKYGGEATGIRTSIVRAVKIK